MHGLAVFEHEGGNLLFHRLDDGRVACKARDLGRALGYGADGKKLLSMIRREWADEFEEGFDFVISKSLDLFRVTQCVTLDEVGRASDLFTSDDLQAPDGIQEDRKHSEPFRVVHHHTLNPRGEMMLTQEGVNIVCIKTDKPVGKLIRRWLARDVLPSLRRDGTYTMPGVAQDGPGEAGALSSAAALAASAAAAMQAVAAATQAIGEAVERISAAVRTLPSPSRGARRAAPRQQLTLLPPTSDEPKLLMAEIVRLGLLCFEKRELMRRLGTRSPKADALAAALDALVDAGLLAEGPPNGRKPTWVVLSS